MHLRFLRTKNKEIEKSNQQQKPQWYLFSLGPFPPHFFCHECVKQLQRRRTPGGTILRLPNLVCHLFYKYRPWAKNGFYLFNSSGVGVGEYQKDDISWLVQILRNSNFSGHKVLTEHSHTILYILSLAAFTLPGQSWAGITRDHIRCYHFALQLGALHIAATRA